MKITGDVISHGGKNETYEEFVSKHKTKKTTDDCYTPPDVYEAVKAFFMKEFGIPEDAVIERPFYPGGDYKSYQYTEKSVVIDNPPFSIMKDIVSFYDSSGIPYVLFCPSLTLPTYTKGGLLITSEYITYENGAKVAASFVHSFRRAIETSGELSRILRETGNKSKKKKKRRYSRQQNIITAGDFLYIARAGIDARIDCWVRKHSIGGHNLYGGALIVSNSTARYMQQKKQEATEAKEPTIYITPNNEEIAISERLNRAEKSDAITTEEGEKNGKEDNRITPEKREEAPHGSLQRSRQQYNGDSNPSDRAGGVHEMPA